MPADGLTFPIGVWCKVDGLAPPSFSLKRFGNLALRLNNDVMRFEAIFNVDAEPGEVRWVPRALANQLINRGFAQSVAALERGGYDTAEVAPEEQGVLDAAPPRKRKGRRATRNEKAEKPASESSGGVAPSAEPTPEEKGLGETDQEPKEKEEPVPEE